MVGSANPVDSLDWPDYVAALRASSAEPVPHARWGRKTFRSTQAACLGQSALATGTVALLIGSVLAAAPLQRRKNRV